MKWDNTPYLLGLDDDRCVDQFEDRVNYAEEVRNNPNLLQTEPTDPDPVPIGISRSTLLRDLAAGEDRRTKAILKLHRLHYHAGVKVITAILQRAGAPADVLSSVAETLRLCKACRPWFPAPSKQMA